MIEYIRRCDALLAARVEIEDGAPDLEDERWEMILSALIEASERAHRDYEEFCAGLGI